MRFRLRRGWTSAMQKSLWRPCLSTWTGRILQALQGRRAGLRTSGSLAHCPGPRGWPRPECHEPGLSSRPEDSICCSEQLIDDGNLIRFIKAGKAKPLLTSQVIAQDEGQPYEPTFAYLGCQARPEERLLPRPQILTAGCPEAFPAFACLGPSS